MQEKPGRLGQPSPGMSIEVICMKAVDLQTCHGAPLQQQSHSKYNRELF
jgi:hypothetical protein